MSRDEPRAGQVAAPARIAAVIVHHGDPSMTRETIEKACASRGVEVLPLVVDNGPGVNESLDRASREAGGACIRPWRNVGFAGGLNLGIAEARRRGAGDLFLFLNHDVSLDPGAAALLAATLQDPAVAIAGPVVFDALRPSFVWSAGGNIEWPSARPRSLFGGRPADLVPAEPFPVDFVCGCALMARGDALERIGPWSEDYFLYFEDADLCYRARRAGYRAEIQPAARALHRAGSAADREPRIADYCRTRGRILFSRRWAPSGSLPKLARWAFALRKAARRDDAGRGSRDGLLGRVGPPPEELFARRFSSIPSET
jgi:GT2 family glycosyltransferase